MLVDLGIVEKPVLCFLRRKAWIFVGELDHYFFNPLVLDRGGWKGVPKNHVPGKFVLGEFLPRIAGSRR